MRPSKGAAFELQSTHRAPLPIMQKWLDTKESKDVGWSPSGGESVGRKVSDMVCCKPGVLEEQSCLSVMQVAAPSFDMELLGSSHSNSCLRCVLSKQLSAVPAHACRAPSRSFSCWR